jgi:hypothetical protein
MRAVATKGKKIGTQSTFPPPTISLRSLASVSFTVSLATPIFYKTY